MTTNWSGRGQPAQIGPAEREKLNNRLEEIERENEELVNVFKVFNKFGRAR